MKLTLWANIVWLAQLLCPVLAVHAPLFNLTVELPPASLRVRGVVTLLGVRRASLVYSGGNPVDAVQSFALRHGGLDMRAKEAIVAALCAQVDCKDRDRYLAATGVPAGDVLALPPHDGVPVQNVGGRWCIDPQLAAALQITVILPPPPPPPPPAAAAAAADAAAGALVLRLVHDRDAPRWAASVVMLQQAARSLGLHVVSGAPGMSVENRTAESSRVSWLLNQNDQPSCPCGSTCCDQDAPLVASYAVRDGFCDVAVPDWTFWHWPPMYGAGGYDAFCARLRAAGATPPLTTALGWVGRVASSTWGGAAHPRQRLARLSAALGEPHLLEVLDSDQHSNAMTLELQVARYAYLLDIEGNGYSGRLKLLLHAGRPLFLVTRPWHEYFHQHLVAWEHYVPVRRDLSDLLVRLAWARRNPVSCRAMAARALVFARSRLQLQDALNELAATMRGTLLLAPDVT